MPSMDMLDPNQLHTRFDIIELLPDINIVFLEYSVILLTTDVG